MSKKDVPKQILTNLAKAAYAAPYNFLPFLCPKGKSVKAAQNWVRQVFKRLLEKKLVKELTVWGRNRGHPIFPLSREKYFLVITQGQKT